MAQTIIGLPNPTLADLRNPPIVSVPYVARNGRVTYVTHGYQGAPLLVHAPCSNPNCLKTVAMAWGGVDPVSRQQRCRRCAIYRSNHGVERIPDPEDHIVRRDNIPPRARGQLGGIMVAPPPPPPPHSLPPPAPAATMQPQRITAGAMYWAPYFLPRSRAVQDPQYRYPSPPSHPY